VGQELECIKKGAGFFDERVLLGKDVYQKKSAYASDEKEELTSKRIHWNSQRHQQIVGRRIRYFTV